MGIGIGIFFNQLSDFFSSKFNIATDMGILFNKLEVD